MKKEGIQTRNRKMTTKSRRTTSLTRSASSVVDTMSSRRLISLRTGPPNTFYDRPPTYYQHVAPAPASTVFSTVQTGLSTADSCFYPPQINGPQSYSEYGGEAYHMVAPAGLCGDGYSAAAPASYLSAVASSQQYLSAAAAAGFHRHLHELL